MKAGWEVKKLGEIAEIQSGSGFPEKFQGITNQDIPFYKVSDMNLVGNEREMTFENNTVSEQVRAQLGATLFPKGSTIFPKIGGAILTNKKRITTKDCCIDNNVMGAIPKKNIIDGKFLHYFFQSHDLLEFSNDAHLPSIRKTVVENWLINIPLSTAEQQRIVAILDQAFEGIAKALANAEQNLQNARALFESHLQSVFTQQGEGWVERKLGDMCDLVNGFAFKSTDAVDKSNTQLVRMGNLYGNSLSLDRNPVFYPDNFAETYRNYLLLEDDLIMSLTGTTGKEDYGYTVKIPSCNHKLLMNQRIVKFELLNTDLINRNFLMYYLRSRVFLDKLYSTANGTRQANLSSVVIKTLPIPICSIEQQFSISKVLDKVYEETQRLEALYQRKITCLDELKKSLLQQAFAGEL